VSANLAGSLWVRGLLTLVVLTVLALRIDLSATAEALFRLTPAAAIAVLALLTVDRGIMVWRWIILLRARGAAVTTKSATWIYLVSSFVGGFLPAGVGADAARAYTLSQRTARGSEAVASVAVDRLFGLLSIVIMGVIGAVIAGRQIDGTPPFLLPATALVVFSGSVAMLWADRVLTALLPAGLRKSGIGRRLSRLADAVSQYRGHRGALAGVALLSLIVQVLRIVQAYLLGRGIGIEVPFSYYLLFMPIGLIALLLPISISGIGAPQGIIVWLLAPAGVPGPQALALSTLIVLSGIVANLPGAWLYLRAAPRLRGQAVNRESGSGRES
jgi:glycosyltransferase 2 family protein